MRFVPFSFGRHTFQGTGVASTTTVNDIEAEMARRTGVSRPVVCDYERGNLRLHGELLIMLARILEVSVDEILGLAPLQPRGPIKDRRFQRRLEQVDRLTRPDREALLRTIDAFLGKGR